MLVKIEGKAPTWKVQDQYAHRLVLWNRTYSSLARITAAGRHHICPAPTSENPNREIFRAIEPGAAFCTYCSIR